MKRFLQLFRDPLVYGPLLFGIAFSLISNALGWDIAFQEIFWLADEHIWSGDSNAVSKWLYHFGVIPALVVAIGGLLCLILSFNIRKLVVTRRVGIYLFLVLAIGNGLITNAMLKEFWGRPRPAQCIQFGGTEPYENSLSQNFTRNGKSFPCGHATMGYYFFALAMLASGRLRRALWLFALLFGAAIAVARSSMGGHFLTDGVWAGIVMWISSYMLYHLLGFKNGWAYVEPPAKNARQAKLRKITGYALIPLLCIVLIAVAVATPRDKTSIIGLEFDPTPTQQLTLDIRGALKIKTDNESARAIIHGTGFGLPKTRLRARTIAGNTPGQQTLEHFVVGFFSELTATTTLELPAGYHYELILPKHEQINQVSINGELINFGPTVTIERNE